MAQKYNKIAIRGQQRALKNVKTPCWQMVYKDFYRFLLLNLVGAGDYLFFLFAKDYEVTREQMIERLRNKYDGYRFSKAKKLVFNPYSLLNSLKSKELNDYWFETGTPTFLANLLKKNDYDLTKIDGKEIDPGSLYKVDNVTPIPLLYQTGYLTIKGYDDDLDAFVLGYPNQEVEAAFINFLIPYYSNIEALQGSVNGHSDKL